MKPIITHGHPQTVRHCLVSHLKLRCDLLCVDALAPHEFPELVQLLSGISPSRHGDYRPWRPLGRSEEGRQYLGQDHRGRVDFSLRRSPSRGSPRGSVGNARVAKRMYMALDGNYKRVPFIFLAAFSLLTLLFLAFSGFLCFALSLGARWRALPSLPSECSSSTRNFFLASRRA